LGFRADFGLGKVYEEGLEEELQAIKRYIEDSESGVDINTYLEMCRVLNNEPDPDMIPVSLYDLRESSQLAFDLYGFLPDRWEGMTATYLGKDFSLMPFLFQEYEIEGYMRKHLLFLFKYIDGSVAEQIQAKQKREAKAAETKSKLPNG